MCPLEIEHECDVFDRFGSDRFLYVQVDLNMVKVSKSMYHFCYFRSLLDNIWIASRQWKVLAEVADNAFVLFAMKGVGIEDPETAPFREVQEWWESAESSFPSYSNGSSRMFENSVTWA